MHEQRIGHISLARLTALRLTELEVHHADLDVGYRVTDWPAAFTRICLPCAPPGSTPTTAFKHAFPGR